MQLQPTFTFIFFETIVVEVGFDPVMDSVNENVGDHEICVFLVGQTERSVSLSVVTTPTNSPGIRP